MERNWRETRRVGEKILSQMERTFDAIVYACNSCLWIGKKRAKYYWQIPLIIELRIDGSRRSLMNVFVPTEVGWMFGMDGLDLGYRKGSCVEGGI